LAFSGQAAVERDVLAQARDVGSDHFDRFLHRLSPIIGRSAF
jgi:hypothetical protein